MAVASGGGAEAAYMWTEVYPVCCHIFSHVCFISQNNVVVNNYSLSPSLTAALSVHYLVAVLVVLPNKPYPRLATVVKSVITQHYVGVRHDV